MADIFVSQRALHPRATLSLTYTPTSKELALSTVVRIVHPPGHHGLHGPDIESTEISALKMPIREQHSIHALLIPAFLQHHTTDEEMRQSAEDSSSSFLLDDDPFADLSHSPTRQGPTPSTSQKSPPNSVPSVTPRSPLSSTISQEHLSFVAFSPVPPTLSRTLSNGGHARPAFNKPAIGPRPSLPSLHSLARMHLSVPHKVRKGKPGAGLPYEPWGDDSDVEFGTLQPPFGQISVSEASSSASFLDLDPAAEDIKDHSQEYEDSLFASSDDGMDAPSLTRTSSDAGCSAQSKSSRSMSSSSSFEEEYDDSISERSFRSMRSHDNYAFESDVLESLTGSDSDAYLEDEANRFCPSPPLDELTIRAPFQPQNTPSSNARGSSASTIGRTLRHRLSDVLRVFSHVQRGDTHTDELIDAGEYRQGEGRPGGQRPAGFTKTGRSIHSSDGGGHGFSNQTPGGSGSGDRRGNDGDKSSSRPVASSFSPPSSDSDSTDDDESDHYGSDNLPPRTAPPTSRVAPGSAPDSADDDVPLATRIPTALKAQKTIIKQVRDERDQRRKDRLARHAERQANPSLAHRTRPGPSTQPNIISSSREASLHASRPVARPKTRTVPAAVASPMIPFTFEDLDQRLKEAQINPVRRPTTRDPSPIDHPQQRLRSRTNEEQPATSYGAEVVRTRTLNHMRSLHREQQQSAPEGTTLTQPLSRNATTARPRGDGYGALKPLVPPVPDLDAGARKYPVEQASRAVNLSRRPSGEHGDLAPPKKSATMQHPPMPPAPAAEVLATYNSLPGVKVAVVQQRIFIADMQRFHMVEVGPATTAQNVLDTITAQGVLDHWRGAGGWMLYELAQDFGMERPVREYELLADVTKPWNKDKLMNAFMVKMTPLATTLARKAMPTSSPTMCGYIEWEQKRGKWGKRWIELREHGLWLSKKDTGKDEIFLCSLTNFDAYVVTRPHKSPKPFVFAIKSTDSLTMFESAADYVHVFSCSQKDGERWVEAIMLARSYVLYQSQQVLFTGATTVTTSTPPIGASGGLSRAGTRKYSGGQRLPPPLVSVPPPFAMAVAPSAAVFEPGSLLAKRGPVP